jgi:O-antigen/teichoic acid export membrane protein
MRRLIRLAGVAASDGFSALLVARILALANAFAVSVALLWAFGLPATGVYVLASFPAAAASLISTFGLANALPRLTLGNGERAAIALTAWLLALPALAVACAFYGAALGRDWGEVQTIALFAWGGGLLGQLGTQQMLYILQGRTRCAPLASLVHLAGIGAALLAPDLNRFALVLTATRLLGCLLGFAPLSFTRFRRDQLALAVHEGAKFVPLDLIAMASEMASVPILAMFLSRAELGLFGLARQFVTVADTPGWSYVQTHYPMMVSDVGSVAAKVARRNEVIAWWTAAAVFPIASLMALAVYHLPALVVVVPVTLLPLPARYMNNFCDQALRAVGRLRECALLAVAKLVFSVVVFVAMTCFFGFWGAIGAFAILSWVSGLAYRRCLLACYPEILCPPRLWRLA